MFGDDPLPFLVINGLCCGLAWLIARHSRFYRRLARPPMAGGRTVMVDGLRGWLALSVFFTHGTAMHAWLTAGRWDADAASLYGRAGQVGVCLFFMITGFLFWRRVLQSAGRLDFASFYRARLRRLLPMYLASVALVLAVVMVASGFSLHVGPAQLGRELRAWLSFGFLPAGSLNGVADAHYINAVYWTLAFEWSFYLALPLLAVLARGRLALLTLPLAAIYALQAPVTLNFIAGGLAAWLVERGLLAPRLRDPRLAPLAFAALLPVFLFPTPFAPAPVLLLFVFFLFVIGGNSLLGLLATPGARVLGTISYSIYLVHCVVLYSVVHLADRRWPLRDLGIYEYWSIAGAAALLAVAVASMTYRYIEHPCMAPRRPGVISRVTAGERIAA